jgi:CubicO group peptidase (beta-lactamase class C family)
MSPPDRLSRLLRDAIGARVFPAAAVEVGTSRGTLWREAFGTLTFDPDAERAGEHTLFDLASLTKPVATTSVVLQLVTTGRLNLSTPLSRFFEQWRGAARAGTTILDLLEHASGLPARLVDPPPHTRREFIEEICRIPLEHAPRSASLYSDLGFILLGFIAEDCGGATLATQFDAIVGPLFAHLFGTREAPDAEQSADWSDAWILRFDLDRRHRERTAPTIPLDEDDRRGRTLVGEVHDSYAARLGGVAGHAGLFGSAAGVGAFARAVLRSARGDAAIPPPLSPSVIARSTTRSTVPGSSRALGWDTMLPSSSCGTRMSPAAFGHVGYTGVSLWIDPTPDRYFVLLTNRACQGGTLDEMRHVRRAFHDLAIELL